MEPIAPWRTLALVRFFEFPCYVVPCHRVGRLEAYNNAFALSYGKELVVLLILCFQESLGPLKLRAAFDDVRRSRHHRGHVTHPILRVLINKESRLVVLAEISNFAGFRVRRHVEDRAIENRTYGH